VRSWRGEWGRGADAGAGARLPRGSAGWPAVANGIVGQGRRRRGYGGCRQMPDLRLTATALTTGGSEAPPSTRRGRTTKATTGAAPTFAVRPQAVAATVGRPGPPSPTALSGRDARPTMNGDDKGRRRTGRRPTMATAVTALSGRDARPTMNGDDNGRRRTGRRPTMATAVTALSGRDARPTMNGDDNGRRRIGVVFNKGRSWRGRMGGRCRVRGSGPRRPVPARFAHTRRWAHSARFARAG